MKLLKLLTKELKKKLPILSKIDEDPLVYIKYFTHFLAGPGISGAFDPEKEIFIGLVDRLKVEWGDFLSEKWKK